MYGRPDMTFLTCVPLIILSSVDKDGTIDIDLDLRVHAL